MTKAKYRAPQHRAERARWAPVVEAGEAYCAQPVCLMPKRWIPPGTRWDVGHDETGQHYIGPTHARCNRSEGAARGNKARGAKPAATPRRWVF